MEEELIELGGEPVRLPLHTKNPAGILANAGRLAALIQREKVDIVHARSRAPAWSAYFACRSTLTPFMTTYHGVYRERQPLKRLYNSVMVRGAAVIANSRYTADLIKVRYRMAGDRVTVIPRGTDLARFSPEAVDPARAAMLRARWGVPEGARIVLHLARLTGWKGQRTVIDAAASVLAAHPDVVFILAGEDQGRVHYRAELQARIRGAGVEEAVRLVGHCVDVPAALALAEVAVVASTEPEAFGRFSVEAQAMGVPPVVTALGAAPETVLAPPHVRAEERTGWHVPPNRPDALAATLREALGLDAEERRQIRERALRHARRFSLEKMVVRTLAVYDELIGGGGPV
jgi:glycosyltransferase involved in cell wall biosynthesis